MGDRLSQYYPTPTRTRSYSVKSFSLSLLVMSLSWVVRLGLCVGVVYRYGGSLGWAAEV